MRLVGPIEHDAYKIVFLLLQALISPLGFFWSQDMRKHRRNFEVARLDEIKSNFRITFNRVFDERIHMHGITPFVRAFERYTSKRIKMNVIEYRGEVSFVMTARTSQQNHLAIFAHKGHHFRHYRRNTGGFDESRNSSPLRQSTQFRR